jgi:hypothetical protein
MIVDFTTKTGFLPESGSRDKSGFCWKIGNQVYVGFECSILHLPTGVKPGFGNLLETAECDRYGGKLRAKSLIQM